MMTIFQDYLRTHPWLTFRLDLQEADHNFWMLLAEAYAKSQFIVDMPLLPDVAEWLHGLTLVRGVLATTAIEGNTLTEQEVADRLEGKLELPPSREYLGKEVDNIAEACNLINSRLHEGASRDLSPKDIRELNRIVLKDLPLNDDVLPGELRKHRAVVGRYLAAPPEDLDYLLNRLCNFLNKFLDESGRYRAAYCILKSIVAHLYLAWIHPFGDGNGRTARLVEFQILSSSGYPTTAAHLLSNHYNKTRTEYYRQLDRASKSSGNIIPFLEYAIEGFRDGLDEQLEVIRDQQLEVHWINYVYNQFSSRHKERDRRIRRLVLDLTDRKAPIERGKVRGISPRVSEYYLGKSERTIQRDLSELKEMGLILESDGEIRVNLRLMFSLFPKSLPNIEDRSR